MSKIIRHVSHTSLSALLLLSALVGCTPTPETVTPTDNTAQATDQATDQAITEGDRTASEANAPDSEANAPDNKAPTAQPEDKTTPAPIFPALAPGEYCYALETETDTIQTRLAIDASDRVTGKVAGSVHNEENAYYTAYNQDIDGTIDGSNLNLDVTTWIEYDKQNKQETWKVSDTTLTTNNNTLTTANCDTVSKAFQDENGLEAKDLTSGANQVHTQQVSFNAGSTGTVVSNAVVRGDRDRYQLIAQGGQQMNIAITALEDNAVFDVVSPSGIILGTELTEETIFLPHTGEYEIIVGGTRGNATYELSIDIE